MPDLDPGYAQRQAEREQRYRDAIAGSDEPNASHLTAEDIVNCDLCDDRGYRGPIVCDHVDRTETNKRGIALCRAELAKRHNDTRTAKKLLSVEDGRQNDVSEASS